MSLGGSVAEKPTAGVIHLPDFKKIDQKEIDQIAERIGKEIKERRQKEREETRLAELDGFIERAKKVGLDYNREQAEFLFNEFARKKHEHCDGRIGPPYDDN